MNIQICSKNLRFFRGHFSSRMFIDTVIDAMHVYRNRRRTFGPVRRHEEAVLPNQQTDLCGMLGRARYLARLEQLQ